MVKIRKGNFIATVPYETYKKHYEKLGYRMKQSKNNNDENKIDNSAVINEEIKESEVIDFSVMNLAQLKDFAERNGIDISEASNKKEIRAIIESAIDI